MKVDSDRNAAQRRGKIFHGWYIVGVTSVAGALAGTTSQAFFGIMLKPLSADLEVSRGVIAGAISAGTIISGLVSPLLGRVTDRFGPRLLMAIGAILLGLAWLGMVWVTVAWHLYVAYVVARIAGLSMVHGVVPRTALVNWFRRYRGRVLGLNSMVTPLGSSLLAIMTASLFAAGFGWRAVFSWFGAGILIVLLIPVLVVMRRRPEDMGLLPDGAPPEETADPSEERRSPRGRRLAPEYPWTLREAKRSRALWLIIVTMVLSAGSSGAISFSLPAYYTDRGLSVEMAAAGTSAFLMAGALSSTVWGYLTERFPERLLATLAFGSGAVLVVGARFVSEPVGAIVFAVLFGATTRGEGTLLTIIIAQYFGRASFGAISGFTSVFQLASLGVGPFVISYAFDRVGSYNQAFFVVGILLAGSAAAMFAAKKPTPPTAQTIQSR